MKVAQMGVKDDFDGAASSHTVTVFPGDSWQCLERLDY